jgi:hypothetical protein
MTRYCSFCKAGSRQLPNHSCNTCAQGVCMLCEHLDEFDNRFYCKKCMLAVCFERINNYIQKVKELCNEEE